MILLLPSATAAPEAIAHQPASVKQYANVSLYAPARDCQPDYVHVYHRTGQPIGNWVARVVGTDLGVVVNDRSGYAYIDVTDDKGTHPPIRIGWDDGHPVNITIGLAGQNPRVYVAVLNSTERYTGCTTTFYLTYS